MARSPSPRCPHEHPRASRNGCGRAADRLRRAPDRLGRRGARARVGRAGGDRRRRPRGGPPGRGARQRSGPPAPRSASDAEALERVSAVREQIAAGAAERDRLRELPAAEIDLLSDVGLLAITVPREYAGADVSLETLARVVSAIASADPNVAQIPQSHFVYLALVRQLGTPAQRELIYGAVLAGQRLANAQSEAGSKTVADIHTRLRGSRRDGYVLDGEKFYCTGSLLAHWLTVLVKDDDGRTQVAILPADTRGVTIVDDWAGMGQRTTASGTVKLEGVAVASGMVVPHHRMFERPQVYGARAQLIHTAIDVGIAQGALEDGG